MQVGGDSIKIQFKKIKSVVKIRFFGRGDPEKPEPEHIYLCVKCVGDFKNFGPAAHKYHKIFNKLFWCVRRMLSKKEALYRLFSLLIGPELTMMYISKLRRYVLCIFQNFRY